MKMQRGFVWPPIFLVIFGVLALSGGAYWYEQTHLAASIEQMDQSATTTPVAPPVTKETSTQPQTVAVGWKTYTNAQYGFSIQYPSSTNLTEDAGGGGGWGGFIHIGNVTIGVTSDPEYNYCPSPAASTIVVINGLNFIERNATGDYSGMNSYTPATEYCTKQGNFAYRLTTFDDTDISEQIVFTFKLISESASPQANGLTVKAIASASYPIDLRNGTSKSVVFGSIANTPVAGGDPGIIQVGNEYFWIYKYEFKNTSRTEATVYIGGNWGASAQDNRVFTVTKTNGQVTAMEVQ